jgi:glycosyltransferase involved in cell wall biosynthesis
MNKKKILFLNPYPFDKAPSQRLKFEQYYKELSDNNWEVSHNAFINNSFWSFIYQQGNTVKKVIYTILAYVKRFFVLFTLRKYDVVYVHLWVSPYGPALFERLARIFSKRLIYDIDDLVFLGHSSEANRFYERLKGKDKMFYLMNKANHVITCTPTLDDFAKKYNKNTTDISSTVDTRERYLAKKDYAFHSKPVIGWSGSHSTSKYLYLIEEQLKELAKEIDFKLIVMGDASFAIDGVDVEAIAWSEGIEMTTLERFDIGLYPLPDEKWVYGKSGLKAIQYMALGIPTVATAIGANYRIIQNGTNGFLVPVDNPSLWTENLKNLLVNESLRKEVGQKARMTIDENYSIHANVSHYLKAING